jgi:uncharacterized protein YjbI with pentapeptide repeats
MIGRRWFMAGLGAVLGVPQPSPAVVRHGRRRISQSELDHAIVQHGRWLEDRALGQRASFAACDLSGLDFGESNPELVFLKAADFTEADLSHVRGNLINFSYASFRYANLSHSQIKDPCFRASDLTNADCANAVWGWSDGELAAPDASEAALSGGFFEATRLSGINFNGARVRGYFFDCSFSCASLCDADFSCSNFHGYPLGPRNHFYRAKLIRTRFHHAKISAAIFDNATIEGADFLGADLQYRIAEHLRQRQAVNVSGW